MARKREGVSNTVKKSLRDMAGGKCANPGCPTTRTHIHHIRQWAVYETNDAAHMVAICPTCHDAVHHGDLPIDDETVYRWKGIVRPDGPRRAHLYVEPGQSTKLLLGSIAVAATDSVVVFEFAETSNLRFRVADKEILLVSLGVRGTDGREIVRVTDNHLRNTIEDNVSVQQIPGHVRLMVPTTDQFVPSWVIALMQRQEPQFGADGQVPLLEIEVLEPGLVKVQGVWFDGDKAVVATKDRLSFLRPQMQQPLSFVGEGAGSVLQWAGPINGTMFGFQ